MNNIVNLTEYKVKKLTMACIKFKGSERSRKYKRLLKNIMDIKIELEKGDDRRRS